MNAMHSVSAGSSEIGDLDGFSIPGDYVYPMQSQYNNNNEDYGFDPPQFNRHEPFSPTAPADPLSISGWSGFETADSKEGFFSPHLGNSKNNSQTFHIERMLNQPIPGPPKALSRFGQITPPRSNSAASEDNKTTDVASPKSYPTERKKRNSKASTKDETEPSQSNVSGKKRKNSRKTSVVNKEEQQDDRRKQSLEKNRLAAAKCRVNKKEKTEQLQRNSHEKAIHNAFLKDQVMRMKEEVQQMNALLLAHANCEGCKSPEEIQKHLSNLGNEFFAHHMSSLNYDYPPVTLDDMSRVGQEDVMQSEYYGNNSSSGMLNPPLPDFDRAAEFEVHTPMQTD